MHVAEWEGEARCSVGWVTLGTGFMQGGRAAPFRGGLPEEYTRWGLSFSAVLLLIVISVVHSELLFQNKKNA